MAEATPGRFCWHELTTPDEGTARAYYTGLFGWSVEEGSRGDAGVYPVFRAGEHAIAGIVPPEEGAGPHWLPYVAVPDVDAAAGRADACGGTVVRGAADLPGIGRYAIVADPCGAHLGLFRGTRPDEEPEGPPRVGAVVWNELLSPDPDRCRPFYTEVFGWEPRTMEMGPMGTYTVFRRGDCDGIGMMKMPEDAPTGSHWLHYVMVEDVDATAGRARELGGRLLVEPDDIPGIGRFAVASDPQGAAFALFGGAG